MGRKTIAMVLTHTQVNFSFSPRTEIRVVLLELEVGSVIRACLVSHVVSVRTVLMIVICMRLYEMCW